MNTLVNLLRRGKNDGVKPPTTPFRAAWNRANLPNGDVLGQMLGLSLFRTRTVALLFSLLIGIGGTPAVSAAGDQGSDVERIEKSLQWRQGEIAIGDNLARLNVPPTFRFIGPKDASAVLTSLWGNPPSEANVLGMIFPAAIEPSDRSSWGVVITYEADGYVKDDDAATINYNDLLKQLQKSIEDQNNQRMKAGYTAVHLVGWAARPHYNRDSHKLYWAKELSFDDVPENTLNYNIRVLGRRGVLVLNAVAAMTQYPEIERQMPQVIAMADFAPGNRYTDFTPGNDKVAGYGLAALIAGGVAAKAGFFKGILALLLAAKKLIIVGIAALGAFLARTFRHRKAAASAASGENAKITRPPGLRQS
jgi:uncharacterized membrane-anchored protein